MNIKKLGLAFLALLGVAASKTEIGNLRVAPLGQGGVDVSPNPLSLNSEVPAPVVFSQLVPSEDGGRGLESVNVTTGADNCVKKISLPRISVTSLRLETTQPPVVFACTLKTQSGRHHLSQIMIPVINNDNKKFTMLAFPYQQGVGASEVKNTLEFANDEIKLTTIKDNIPSASNLTIPKNCTWGGYVSIYTNEIEEITDFGPGCYINISPTIAPISSPGGTSQPPSPSPSPTAMPSAPTIEIKDMQGVPVVIIGSLVGSILGYVAVCAARNKFIQKFNQKTNVRPSPFSSAAQNNTAMVPRTDDERPPRGNRRH